MLDSKFPDVLELGSSKEDMESEFDGSIAGTTTGDHTVINTNHHIIEDGRKIISIKP